MVCVDESSKFLGYKFAHGTALGVYPPEDFVGDPVSRSWMILTSDPLLPKLPILFYHFAYRILLNSLRLHFLQLQRPRQLPQPPFMFHYLFNCGFFAIFGKLWPIFGNLVLVLKKASVV